MHNQTFGKLNRTIYAISSPADALYGHLVLKSGGSVSGYAHSNEAQWKLDNDQLVFLNTNGDETSRLSAQGSCWLGHSTNSKWPISLVPLLALDAATHDRKLPPVFVNSIPKSGTYLLDALLTRMGWRPLRLHVFGHNGVDDYRGLADSEMHKNPERQRLACPFECLGAVLAPGDVIVGHVAERDAVRRLTSGGATELFLKRNLRDVLCSYYRFKIGKVEPRNPADEVWRGLPESERFIGYLSHFGNSDLTYLKEMAESHLVADGIVLKFEELANLTLPASFMSWLESIEAGLSVRCMSAVRAVLDTETSTFSGARSNWKELWDERIERFFDASGLKDVNARLGYEQA